MSVKWIKIVTDIFDNKKIKQIENLPDGDAIIVIWVKLLCLAGKINDFGMVYLTKEIPYNDQMLANQFNRPLATVQAAIAVFEQFAMVEVVDDILQISNWERYQNVEGMEKIREQNRLRKQRQREREDELLALDVSRDMSRDVTQQNKNKNKNKKEKEEKENTDYKGIKDAFNSLCPSLPLVKSLSDARKKTIKSRLNQYSHEEIEGAFLKAEESDFLKGKNERGWKANFDWIMKDANMAKVIDGNYDNNGKTPPKIDKSKDDLDELF